MSGGSGQAVSGNIVLALPLQVLFPTRCVLVSLCHSLV